ncbi:unnamed protein product [Prunus armeniaca]|uniref:Uncharacterized protein n=1 Tax=Prunus armeniaca TaxID=36596 RepID=A0A6J5WFJ3_PRUAR|nr:unnamed protein product [Prunus armeniaca]CAB4299093.1 unnamed protein product [Prunus armeniaca]
MVLIVDLFNYSKSYGLLHFIDRGREGKSSAAWDKTILIVHRNDSLICGTQLATFWTKTSLVHINSISSMRKSGLRVKEGKLSVAFNYRSS